MDRADIPHNRPWKRGLVVGAVVLTLSLLYAFVRYNILRDVPYSDIPLYIFNKGLALGSTIVIGFAFLLGPLAALSPRQFLPHLPLRQSLGIIGFGGAAVHGFISLILLSPAYYAKFYTASGGLNAIGQFSLLFGVLALAVFTIIAISSLPMMFERLGEARWKKIQSLGYSAFLLVFLHVVVMGARGWINPESYSYGFISVSLLAALFIVLVFVIRSVAYVYRGGRDNHNS